MNDYLTAYHKRRTGVHITMLKFAKELIEAGCQVFTSEIGITNKLTFVSIFKDGKEITLEFNEVPYRWTLHRAIDIKEGRGSSVTVETIHGTEFPYDVETILSKMKPYFSTPENYFKREVGWMHELTIERIDNLLKEAEKNDKRRGTTRM